MKGDKVSPHPLLAIASDSPYNLPLSHFDFLIFVEPNQDTWKIDPNAPSIEENEWRSKIDAIDFEFGWRAGEETIEGISSRILHNPQIGICPQTKAIWIKNEMEDANYFENCITASASSAIFPYNLGNAELPEFFLLFIPTIKNYFPDLKVAVVGGMFFDEVTQVANFMQTAGFSTTILSRYCFSESGFLTMN